MISLYGMANGLSGSQFSDSDASKEANATKKTITVGSKSFSTKGVAAAWYPIVWPVIARHFAGESLQAKPLTVIQAPMLNMIKQGQFVYFDLDDIYSYQMSKNVDKLSVWMKWDKGQLWAQIKHIAAAYNKGQYPYGAQWSKGSAGYAYKQGAQQVKAYKASVAPKPKKKVVEDPKKKVAKKPGTKITPADPSSPTDEGLVTAPPPGPGSKKAGMGIGVIIGAVVILLLVMRKKT